jgi:hypothetical protein
MEIGRMMVAVDLTIEGRVFRIRKMSVFGLSAHADYPGDQC